MAFISGHTNLSISEFDTHYKSILDDLINNSNTSVVIGNAYGADKMCFDYLIKNNYPKDLITVYFYGTGVAIDYFKSHGVNIINGFSSYTKRDAQMTQKSDYDILWVRPEEDNKRLVESMGLVYRKRVSGTELNKLRREKLKNK